MSNALATDYNNHIEGDTVPVYTVIIQRDESGFWGVCDMPNGGANSMGNTIYETQRNMYESMALFLKDDYPEVSDFSLNFVISK